MGNLDINDMSIKKRIHELFRLLTTASRGLLESKTAIRDAAGGRFLYV